MQINLANSMRTHSERCSFQLTFENGNDLRHMCCAIPRGINNGQSAEIYTKLFHATRWIMLYMKDKLEFFSPTHLQVLDFVLLP